jgi:CHAT domain-containing protein
MRSKSKSLLDLLKNSNIQPKIKSKEIENYLKEEGFLLTKKRILQNRFIQRTINNNINFPYDDLYLIDNKLEKIYRELEKIDYNYVSLRKLNSISIKEIQQYLNSEDVILIEYYIVKDEIYIFLISKNEFDTIIINLNINILDEYIKNYENEVINYTNFLNNEESLTFKWKELSQYLTEPFKEFVKGKKLIYFIPHKVLHFLPFCALNIDNEPLIKKYPIVYLANAISLKFHNQVETNRNHIPTCTAIGIYEQNEDSFFSKEAEEISKIFDSIPYIDCSKNDILNNIESDIIYFATHGKFNKNKPLLSEIQLNKKETLQVLEVFNLTLKASLVTLSACESGINKYYSGDEFIGLTRAFSYAGAKSIIVSLWPVFNPSTYDFMLRFYRKIKNRKIKTITLQESIMSLMEYKNYSHPYYWAPFILIG